MEARYFSTVVKTNVTFWKPGLTHWRVPRPAWPDLMSDAAARPLSNPAPPGGVGPISLCNSEVSAETGQANFSPYANTVLQGLASLTQQVSIQ